MPVNTCQAWAWETGSGSALLGTKTRCPRLAGGGRDSRTTAPMALVQSPRKEPRRKGGRVGGEGRHRVSAAQCVAKFVFFFSFSPFFLSKKCMKARQPLCNGQQCFLGDGGGGEGTPPGPAPQLAPEGGLVLLKNVSQFKYQTKNRARRTTLAVAKSLPE